MPRRPPTPCRRRGCAALVDGGGFCPDHARAEWRRRDASRPSSSARLYDRWWRAERLHHLADQPLCVRCQREGLVVEATEVDHIVPHRGDRKLFRDRSNWQSLCGRCHKIKTAREVGTFGR